MAVNWSLAQPTAGPLDLLRAAGQRQLERVQLQSQEAQAKRLELQSQREEQQFQRQQRIDQRRQAIGGQVAQGDLAGARTAALQEGDFEFANQIASLSKEQRAEAAKHAQIAATTLFDIRKLPAEQRAAAWESAKPALRTQGLDDDDFATIGADLSDNGINAAVSSVQTIADKIKQATDERDYGFKVERAGVEDKQFDRTLTSQEQRARENNAITVRGQNISSANAAAGRAVTLRGQNISAATQANTNARQGMQMTAGLRKEFDALPEVKNFNIIRSQASQIKPLAKQATGQSDTALVYTYMKMLDPNSVVREGEFGMVGKNAGLGESLQRALTRADNGQMLTPKMRQDVVSAANQIYTQQRENYRQVAQRFRSYASDSGIDPSKVAPIYKNKPNPAAAPVTIAPGITIERLR